ncbi:MAG: DUF5615 family PIN-like protein [Gemmatimonadaceae bacterium]
MKLLLDANLSHHLGPMLEAHFPASTHARKVELARGTDDTIWQYARDHGFTVDSKDSDFHRRSLTLGAPPKVIWVRVGNAPTAMIGALIVERRAEIEAFLQNADATFLPLSYRPAGQLLCQFLPSECSFRLVRTRHR